MTTDRDFVIVRAVEHLNKGSVMGKKLEFLRSTNGGEVGASTEDMPTGSDT
jgi:hypothetical protein